VSVAVPPRIETRRDLLLADLAQLLTIEGTLARVVLPELHRSASDPELRGALERHARETHEHVARIEQAFRILGNEPRGKDAPGLEGLREEQRVIAEVGPAVRDVYVAGAALGGEHYEIAIYSSIVPAAEAEAPDVAELLTENLRQEFEAMRRLEHIAERLSKA
jgi:ferritin-like metal-binding protein YciE